MARKKIFSVTKSLLRFIILLGVFIKVNGAGRPELPEDMLEIVEMVHNSCVDKTGVAEADIANCIKGVFADDRKLKCYMYCLMEEASFVDDDGAVDYDMLISMIPDQWRDGVAAMIGACRHLDVPGKDSCDKAFEVHQCLYKHSPDVYFLF